MSGEADSVSLDTSGQFTTRSLYPKLFQDPVVPFADDIWKGHISLKIKMFLSQLARCQLSSGDQVLKRRGPSVGKCAFCRENEDVNHILFSCVLARFVWSGVHHILRVPWMPSCWLAISAILQLQTGKTSVFIGYSLQPPFGLFGWFVIK